MYSLTIISAFSATGMVLTSNFPTSIFLLAVHFFYVCHEISTVLSKKITLSEHLLKTRVILILHIDTVIMIGNIDTLPVNTDDNILYNSS